MKKIMFLYHVKEREYRIIDLIAQQLKEEYGNVEIRIGEFYSSIFDTIRFMPDVIVTMPPRDDSSSNYLTVLKVITGAVVISMNTEGHYDFSPYDVKMAIGFNTYAKELVDYYLMWGPKTKDILGKALIESSKLIDLRRVKVIGYALYEIEKVNKSYKKDNRYLSIQTWSKKFKKNMLVLTGFLAAYNTLEEYQEFGCFGNDTPLQERTSMEIKQAEKSIETEIEFRKKYIDMIIWLAERNPEVGIIVKLHPIEIEVRVNCYDKLSEYSNIFLVKKAIPVGVILNSVDCMIHYNSTCGAEAYVYGVPTIQMYDDSKNTSLPFVWQLKGSSTYLLHINNFQELGKIVNNKVSFTRSKSMEQELIDLYDWKSGKPYRAVEKSAYYIFHSRISQRLKYSDLEVFKAIQSKQGKRVFEILYKDIFLNNSGCKTICKDIYALFRISQYFLLHKLSGILNSVFGGVV